MNEYNAKNYDMSSFKMKIFLYGNWRTGKTWFCGSMTKPVLICTEAGAIGLATAKKDVDIVEIETFRELQLIVDDITFERKYKDRQCVAIDGLTEITELLIAHLNPGKGGTTSSRTGATLSRMNQQKWGVAVDSLRMVIKQFTDLASTGKKHVCLTSKALVVKDDLQGGTFGLPITIGKYAYAVPGMFDFVFYTRKDVQWIEGVQHPVYLMYVMPYGQFPAGERVGVLDAVEKNDFDSIYQKFLTRKPKPIPDYNPQFLAPVGASIAGDNAT